MFCEARNHSEFALQVFLTTDDITENSAIKQGPLSKI